MEEIKKEELVEKEERGATMVEYGVMVALILVLCIVAVQGIGQKTSTAFSQVNSTLN